MAEIFLAVPIQVLLEKLLSGDLIKFARREGVHAKVEKWKRMLLKIQAVLTDAEERQITNKAVKPWLEDLRDLAYDVDDVLDEFSTKALQCQLMAEPHASSSRVRSLIPTCCTNFKPSAFMFTFKMKSKIDEITARLQEIVKQKHELDLIKHAGGMSNRIGERTTYATTSIPESHIYGREKDKEAVVELLLGGEASNDKVCVIPVIGMGGVGKTTLAQLVYNDGRVQNSFDPKAWVCVSEAFDLVQVTKAILESFTNGSPTVNSLNSLQESLKGTLSGKKFLLVLDDVWLENYEQWTILRRPLEVGAPGSKIIVTARNQGVSSMVSPFRPPHTLKTLSNDECLSVFTQHALGTRDFDAHPNFKSVGEEIVKKCNGLPLAAKALGGLLASKVDIVEWERVLHSQIWDLKDSTIIPALRLSYNHLPPHLKQCFAYCAVFPKDYEFREEELVLLWTASGLVQQGNEGRQVEDIGAEYFQDLLSRSFFQSSSADVSKFVMHDLFNDLAQLVAGETCFRLEDKNRSKKNIKKARYSSYIRSSYEVVENFEAFDKVGGCLRSFLPLMIPHWRCYLTNHVLLNLLPKFTCLRVLSLGGYEIFELPDSIGQLKHLSYLDLSRTKIRSLPEWVSTLCNLQTLILRGCSRLKKLPTEMSNLISLRHLDLEDAGSLEEMPPKVGKLKNLRKLSKFVVGNNSGSGIGELKNLKYLRGTLEISRLDNVINAGDARAASLKDKQDLDVLKMEWSSDFNDSRNEGVEEEVLDKLQPHEKLKELTIKCYGGMKFPSWVGGTFSDMVFLMFQSCVKCTSLPPLEQLLSLRKLSIIDCPKLLGKLPDHFPCLEELVIKGCQQFVVSISSFPTLHKLEIEKCQEVLVQGNTVDLSSLESMALSNISNLMCLIEGFVKGLRKLQDLKLIGCNGLTSLWQRDVGLLQHLPSLHRLRIVGCPQFIFSAVEEAEQGMPCALEYLELESCHNLEKLQGLHCLTSLEELRIKGYSGLVGFSETGQLPSTLKTLEIEDCKNLRSLALDEEKSNNSGTCVSEVQCPSVTTSSTLKTLWISHCPKLESVSGSLHDHTSLEEIGFYNCESLKSLPEGLHNLTHLSSIFIDRCPSLVSFPVVGLPATNLRQLIISGCEKLEALPKRMHNFTSLQSLHIYDCPGIVSFPEEGFPTNLKSLSIKKIPNICEALFEWGLHRLTSLTELTIDAGCPNLVCLQDEEKGMMLPTSLTDLEIHSFPNIEYLSSNSKGFQNLTSLQNLSISNCPKFKSFPDEGLPPSLEKLSIYNCHKLKSFPEEGLPPSLQSLAITSCPELKCFPEKGLPPSLQSLDIDSCPELKCFPEKGLPPSLQELYISDCPLLKQRCKKDQGRDWPKIAHIPRVEIDGRFIYDPED